METVVGMVSSLDERGGTYKGSMRRTEDRGERNEKRGEYRTA